MAYQRIKSAFQRRQYEAIAQAMQEAQREIIAKEPSETGPERKRVADLIDGVGYAIDFMVEAFKRDNSQFNGERFRAACVPGANVRARTRYSVPSIEEGAR